MLKRRDLQARIFVKSAVEISTRLQDSMRVKEHLQCDTSAMSFTSAVLLSDKDVGKIKMEKRKDFAHFSIN